VESGSAGLPSQADGLALEGLRGEQRPPVLPELLDAPAREHAEHRRPKPPRRQQLDERFLRAAVAQRLPRPVDAHQRPSLAASAAHEEEVVGDAAGDPRRRAPARPRRELGHGGRGLAQATLRDGVHCRHGCGLRARTTIIIGSYTTFG
jgi:hypothetical protein